MIVCILITQVKEWGLYDAVFVGPSGERLRANNKIIFVYMMKHRFRLMTIAILASTMAVMMTFFCLYHMRLILHGVTTNESGKWADAYDYFTDLIDTWRENTRACSAAEKLTNQNVDPPLMHKKRSPPSNGQKIGDDPHSDNDPMNNLMEKDEKMPGVELSNQYSGGVTPVSLESKVPLPHPGDMPLNIYNIGLWGNLGEVLWPRYCRPPHKRKRNWGNALETSQTVY